MSNLNENLDKVKATAENVTQKVKDSEAVDKIKNTASEVTQKLKENEKVAEAIDKINENEYVSKIKKSKYSKYIKIGSIILAVILVFNIVGAVFGDKKASKAGKAIVSEYTTEYKDDSYTNVKVKTKAIGKNKSAHLYCFDVTITAKYYNDKVKDTYFVIAYSDGSEAYAVREIEYNESNKSEKKDYAISVLSRG